MSTIKYHNGISVKMRYLQDTPLESLGWFGKCAARLLAARGELVRFAKGETDRLDIEWLVKKVQP